MCCFSLLPENFLKNDFGHLTVPFFDGYFKMNLNMFVHLDKYIQIDSLVLLQYFLEIWTSFQIRKFSILMTPAFKGAIFGWGGEHICIHMFL